jgi:hypothetical protein
MCHASSPTCPLLLLLLLFIFAFQVSSITIQPEVMHLLRQLLATWLPRSEPIKQVLLSLPHVNQQVSLCSESLQAIR